MSHKCQRGRPARGGHWARCQHRSSETPLGPPPGQRPLPAPAPPPAHSLRCDLIAFGILSGALLLIAAIAWLTVTLGVRAH